MKFAIIALVFGILITGICVYGIQKSLRLKNGGVEAVVDSVKFFKVNDPGRGSQSLHLKYTFTTQSGVKIESITTVPADAPQTYKMPLRVVYLPYHPEVNELTNTSSALFYPAGIFGLALIGLSYYLYRRAKAKAIAS